MVFTGKLDWTLNEPIDFWAYRPQNAFSCWGKKAFAVAPLFSATGPAVDRQTTLQRLETMVETVPFAGICRGIITHQGSWLVRNGFIHPQRVSGLLVCPKIKPFSGGKNAFPMSKIDSRTEPRTSKGECVLGKSTDLKADRPHLSLKYPVTNLKGPSGS